MVDVYICPSCDNEVVVGESCVVCSNRAKLAEKRMRSKANKSKVKAKKSTRKPWEQDEMYDGLDLPDDDFDYDEFTKKEFSKIPHHQIGIAWYWWLTAICVFIVMFFFWVF